MEIKVLSKKEDDTISLGEKIGKFLKPGDLVLIYGDLGTGKTTFVKGLAKSLKVPSNLYITSPTFSIINIYEGIYTIYHIDLYRLDPEDVEELNFWEYLTQGILVIEWADKISEYPTENFLEINFKLVNSHREITIIGYGEMKHILKALDLNEE